ncbi:MAG: cytochrome c [Sphingomonadales bacterium]|nr:cytochrome c [Sphingomonadales bacterium]
MSSSPRFRILASLALAGIAAPLLAAPADQVKTRVAGLRELGAAFKAVNDGLRSPTPQTILIQMSARQIRNAAQQQYNWFPVGSGPQPGVKTAAKAEIWSQPARFRQLQDGFAAQAAAFQTAAGSGNVDAIRAAARSLGGSCKACHDEFRVPKD